MVLILLAASPANAFGAFSPAKYRETLISQINYYRTHHGLPALVWNDDLQRAASAHTENMAQHHMLSHTSASGVSWSTRIRWSGFTGSWIGETLGSGWSSPTACSSGGSPVPRTARTCSAATSGVPESGL